MASRLLAVRNRADAKQLGVRAVDDPCAGPDHVRRFASVAKRALPPRGLALVAILWLGVASAQQRAAIEIQVLPLEAARGAVVSVTGPDDFESELQPGQEMSLGGLETGTYTVSAAAPGYAPSSREVAVEVGRTTRVALELTDVGCVNRFPVLERGVGRRG